MLVEIASRFRVGGIQVTTNHMAIPLALAVLCVAFENMDTTFLDVFNRRHWLEETYMGEFHIRKKGFGPEETQVALGVSRDSKDIKD
jgi:hypothetical protein